MKTLPMAKMLAGALVLTVVLMFGVQRQAQAGDTGKIIAAAVVGAIVYEALDDDGDRWCSKRHKHTKRCNHNRYDRPRAYRGTPAQYGWNTPLPTRHGNYRYEAPRRQNRFEAAWTDNDCGRRGRATYQAPGKRAKVKVRNNSHRTQLNFQYRDW